MRNIIILLIFISAYSCINYKQYHPKKILKINNHDTVINLSKNRILYFTKYKEIIKGDSLYTKSYILDDKKDTIFKFPSDGIYTSGWYSLSPNKKFLIIDAVQLGYVYITERDSILHDTYNCSLINLKDGSYIDVDGLRDICGGDSLWNKKNQLINNSYGDEIIIFDPLKDLNH